MVVVFFCAVRVLYNEINYASTSIRLYASFKPPIISKAVSFSKLASSEILHFAIYKVGNKQNNINQRIKFNTLTKA